MNTDIDRELESIKLVSGKLSPERVIDFARTHPESALHKSFDWDDDEAAHSWRMHQARQIIRCRVTMLPNCPDPVRAYVSLGSDRADEGGYRPIEKVLRSKPMRDEMLADALREMSTFRRKYAALAALAPIFAALEKVLKSAPAANRDFTQPTL